MRISDWIADVCSADLRAEWRRSDEIPFDARYRYMATRHAAPAGGQTVFVKGAPEQLLAMCAAEATEAGPQPVDHDYWNARIARTASEGERVLGFAGKTRSEERRGGKEWVSTWRTRGSPDQ